MVIDYNDGLTDKSRDFFLLVLFAVTSLYGGVTVFDEVKGTHYYVCASLLLVGSWCCLLLGLLFLRNKG